MDVNTAKNILKDKLKEIIMSEQAHLTRQLLPNMRNNDCSAAKNERCPKDVADWNRCFMDAWTEISNGIDAL